MKYYTCTCIGTIFGHGHTHMQTLECDISSWKIGPSQLQDNTALSMMLIIEQQQLLDKTRRVCETWMPPAATKSKYGKISESYILTLPHPKGR